MYGKRHEKAIKAKPKKGWTRLDKKILEKTRKGKEGHNQTRKATEIQ